MDTSIKISEDRNEIQFGDLSFTYDEKNKLLQVDVYGEETIGSAEVVTREMWHGFVQRVIGSAEVTSLRPPLDLYPRTPREALLMIGGWANTRLHMVGQRGHEAEELATLVNEGLRGTDPQTFEENDLLADRLAEAHHVLRDLRDSGMLDPDALAEQGGRDGVEALRLGRELVDRTHRALALPPDLEAKIDLRPRGG